jgi:voltage-gated potassium channel
LKRTQQSFVSDKDHLGIRWGFLLGLLLTVFILKPVFGSSLLTEMASIALLQFSVVGALLISATPRRFRIFFFGLSGIWFLASELALVNAQLHGTVAVLSAALLVASLVVTFGNLMKQSHDDIEALLGGIFGYLLLAIVWAVLFVWIERWKPGSFVFAEQSDLSSTMIYHSLVTLTTLGYGDVLPSTPIAEVAAGLEAVVGVLYVAVMIGSIVGTYQSRGPD